MTGDKLAGYLLSLPERVVRSATAVSAGLVRELGEVTVPASVRRTRLYQSMVDSTLRFLIEQVGEVEGAYPVEGRLAQDFALRRAAGNGLELIGILTFRASPVWVMAALADLSGAGRRLVQEICESLKQEGLLDPEASYETVDQMLDGLEKWAGRVAEAINTPPLDVNDLRREWAEIRQQARGLPPSALPSPYLVQRQWEEVKREAAEQGRSVFELSGLMALSAISRLPANVQRLGRSARVASVSAGRLVAGSLLDHYASTLKEIHQTGYLEFFGREMRPYLRGAAAQFTPGRLTMTEKFLRRPPGR
jgi:hypothetical protein